MISFAQLAQISCILMQLIPVELIQLVKMETCTRNNY